MGASVTAVGVSAACARDPEAGATAPSPPRARAPHRPSAALLPDPSFTTARLSAPRDGARARRRPTHRGARPRTGPRRRWSAPPPDASRAPAQAGARARCLRPHSRDAHPPHRPRTRDRRSAPRQGARRGCARGRCPRTRCRARDASCSAARTTPSRCRAAPPDAAASPRTVSDASRASSPPEAETPSVWLSVSGGPRSLSGAGSQASEPAKPRSLKPSAACVSCPRARSSACTPSDGSAHASPAPISAPNPVSASPPSWRTPTSPRPLQTEPQPRHLGLRGPETPW